jgi:hypothetical protein
MEIPDKTRPFVWRGRENNSIIIMGSIEVSNEKLTLMMAYGTETLFARR